MSSKPKIHRLANLQKLAARLRDDLNNPTKTTDLILVFAYNRTGKTRPLGQAGNASAWSYGYDGANRPLWTTNVSHRGGERDDADGQ